MLANAGRNTFHSYSKFDVLKCTKIAIHIKTIKTILILAFHTIEYTICNTTSSYTVIAVENWYPYDVVFRIPMAKKIDYKSF